MDTPSLNLVKQKKKTMFFALILRIIGKYIKGLLKSWLIVIVGCFVSYIAAFAFNIYILMIKNGGLNMGITALAGNDIWYGFLQHPAIKSGAWAFYFFFFTLISKIISDIISRGMKRFLESIAHCGRWFLECLNNESPNRIRVFLVSAGIAQFVGIMTKNGPARISLLLLFFFSFIKRDKSFFNHVGCFLITTAERIFHWPKIEAARSSLLSGLISIGFMAGITIEIVMGSYSGTVLSYLSAIIFIVIGLVPSFSKYAAAGPYYMLIAASAAVIAFFTVSVRIVSAQDTICSQDLITVFTNGGFSAVFYIGNAAGISGMAGFLFGTVLGGSAQLTESIAESTAVRHDTPVRTTSEMKNSVYNYNDAILLNLYKSLTDFKVSLVSELIPVQSRNFINTLNSSLSSYLNDNQAIFLNEGSIDYENIRNAIINNTQGIRQYMQGFIGEPVNAALYANAERIMEQFADLAMKDPVMLKAFIERYAEDSYFTKMVELAIGDPSRYRRFINVLGDEYMKALEMLFKPYGDLGNEWDKFEAMKTTDPAKYAQGLELFAGIGIGDVMGIAGDVPKLFQSIDAFKDFAANTIDWISNNSGLQELVRGFDFFDNSNSLMQKGNSLRVGWNKLISNATSIYNHLNMIKTAKQELADKTGCQSQTPPHSTV